MNSRRNTELKETIESNALIIVSNNRRSRLTEENNTTHGRRVIKVKNRSQEWLSISERWWSLKVGALQRDRFTAAPPAGSRQSSRRRGWNPSCGNEEPLGQHTYHAKVVIE